MTTKSERKLYIALFPFYIAMVDESSLILEASIKSPNPYATCIPFKSDPTLLVLEQKDNGYNTTILPNNEIPIKYKMDVDGIKIGKDSVELHGVIRDTLSRYKTYILRRDSNGWGLIIDKYDLDNGIAISMKRDSEDRSPISLGTDLKEYYSIVGNDSNGRILFKVHRKDENGISEVLALPSVGSISLRDTPPIVIPIEGEGRAQKAFEMLESYFNDKMMF